jgi:hypothetical protein
MSRSIFGPFDRPCYCTATEEFPHEFTYGDLCCDGRFTHPVEEDGSSPQLAMQLAYQVARQELTLARAIYTMDDLETRVRALEER